MPERGESNKQACCLECAGVVCPTGTLTAAAPAGLRREVAPAGLPAGCILSSSSLVNW